VKAGVGGRASQGCIPAPAPGRPAQLTMCQRLPLGAGPAGPQGYLHHDIKYQNVVRDASAATPVTSLIDTGMSVSLRKLRAATSFEEVGCCRAWEAAP